MYVTSKNPSFYVNPLYMTNCKKSKDYLEAYVTGTDVYRVKVPVKDAKLSSYCTCPAFKSYSGDCKHITAVYMAYEKHPEWFAGFRKTSVKLQTLEKKQLVKILKLLFDAVPDARDIIESELSGKQNKNDEYSKKIRKLFKACSMDQIDVDNLHGKLDIYVKRAREFQRSKEYLRCLCVCYEIVHGCLSLDTQWGSTEIFSDGLVNEVWSLYLDALERARLTKDGRDTVRKQIAALRKFEDYLFDQECVYPGEAEVILNKM